MERDQEVERAVEAYSDLIRRLCLLNLKNRADSEDIAQTVFLKFLLYPQTFESSAHERAWFIRVTMNCCKDFLRALRRHPTLPLELLEEEPTLEEPQREVLAAVLALPKNYKDPIYLHYYEGYSAAEIATILGKRENTIYSLLSRGRGLLRNVLGGDEDGG